MGLRTREGGLYPGFCGVSVLPETDGHPSGTVVADGLERLPVELEAGRSCALSGRPLFALHRMGFALPSLLPGKRWALTPPFHPCLWPCGPLAVSSLLHFPSRCRAQPLAGTSPCGARKFLQAFAQRPSGPRLVRSPVPRRTQTSAEGKGTPCARGCVSRNRSPDRRRPDACPPGSAVPAAGGSARAQNG